MDNTSTIKKIALMGGSFNPPHIAHLTEAVNAKKQLQADEAWLMVSPQNPLKSSEGMASFQHRYAMTQLIAEPYPEVKATDIEKNIHTNQTFDTISLLRKKFNHMFVWIMGADCLSSFHKWKNWKGISNQVPIAVFSRPGYDVDTAPALKENVMEKRSPKDIDGPNQWCFLEESFLDISSTNIRNAIAKEDPAAQIMTSPDVFAYMIKHQLYK